MNAIPLAVPWLELAILIATVGALVVGRLSDPARAWMWGLLFTGATFGCSLPACYGYYLCQRYDVEPSWSFSSYLFDQEFFAVDELNAPLLPLLPLLHFLTALATGRTKMRRFSLSWSLASVAIRLSIFGCKDPWVLIGFLVFCIVPPYMELRNRGKPTRVYLLHMGLFVALLILGWWLRERHNIASVALLLAILIRCGAVPAHCWITDWFEHASFGNALLFVTPLVGVYAGLRLVLPISPDWVLRGIGFVSLITAVYSAAMSCVQRQTRRFFAYLFLSHASLVLVGLELHTTISLTGALALWISVSLSLGGFGLTLRALEARYGRLSLAEFHGLYEQSPMLAVCFLLTGLASVGFPGTLGFVATELLVDGAIEASPLTGVGVILAAALNGIAIVRAYFALFTGTQRKSTVSLSVGVRERIAVLTLAALILGGGIFPQPGISSRHRAAKTILKKRKKMLVDDSAPSDVSRNTFAPMTGNENE